MPTQSAKAQSTKSESDESQSDESQSELDPQPELTPLQELFAKKARAAARVKELEKDIRKKQNSQSQAERKLDDHKKILQGVILRHLIETGQMSYEVFLTTADTYLTKECDRKVFGLEGGTKPVKKEPKPSKEETPQASEDDDQAADQTDDKTDNKTSPPIIKTAVTLEEADI